ncbi:NACHT, LRR and PYD domains-containing protein 1b allele 2-like [Dromaius novaehollandiae]|uniref:NACHT, LRR and PYD domains-containing protein 1b allele 2-like n=1 Tax=Dromaius novaehollandiae TaxID=8790 RepID=UPI00311E6829
MEMSRSDEQGFSLVAEREAETHGQAEVASWMQQDAALVEMSRFGFSSSSEEDSSDPDVSLVARRREEDSCGRCQRDKCLPEATVPEIIWDEGGKKAYRVSLPGASSFRCAETDLCFDVKAAVTLSYEYGSWQQHLRGGDAKRWTFVGPLFNIRAEPAGAVGAVYLPHFVCLRGGAASWHPPPPSPSFSSSKAEVRESPLWAHRLNLGQGDTSKMRTGHFVDGKLVLETPARVKPFHAVLENASFSFLGLLWRKIASILHFPIHSLVLIYHATRKEPVTLHLYLIPDDRSIKQAIEETEKKSMSYRVDKPPLTKRVNCGRSYVVSGSAPIAIQPKILDFHLRGADKQQIFSEIYLSVMVEEVKLSLKDEERDKCMWHAVLRRGRCLASFPLQHGEAVRCPKEGRLVPKSFQTEAEPSKRLFLLAAEETEGDELDCTYLPDIAPSGAGADAPRASCRPPRSRRSRPGWADRGQIPGASATTTEKHFLDLHRVELINRVVEVKGVLDLLLGDVLDFEQYQRILAEKTSHSRMRELFKLMPSWTPWCKDRIYEALKEKHPHLVEDLEK